MSRSKYIILHIPKNGGTSLIEILSSQFYNWQIYAIPDYKRSEFVLKLKKPLFVKKLNTSDKQLEKIDSAVNRKIIELNAFDLKLYSRFRSKFESEFDSIGNPEYEKFKNSLKNLGESKS